METGRVAVRGVMLRWQACDGRKTERKRWARWYQRCLMECKRFRIVGRTFKPGYWTHVQGKNRKVTYQKGEM